MPPANLHRNSSARDSNARTIESRILHESEDVARTTVAWSHERRFSSRRVQFLEFGNLAEDDRVVVYHLTATPTLSPIADFTCTLSSSRSHSCSPKSRLLYCASLLVHSLYSRGWTTSPHFLTSIFSISVASNSMPLRICVKFLSSTYYSLTLFLSCQLCRWSSSSLSASSSPLDALDHR